MPFEHGFGLNNAQHSLQLFHWPPAHRPELGHQDRQRELIDARGRYPFLVVPFQGGCLSSRQQDLQNFFLFGLSLEQNDSQESGENLHQQKADHWFLVQQAIRLGNYRVKSPMDCLQDEVFWEYGVRKRRNSTHSSRRFVCRFGEQQRGVMMSALTLIPDKKPRTHMNGSERLFPVFRLDRIGRAFDLDGGHGTAAR